MLFRVRVSGVLVAATLMLGARSATGQDLGIDPDLVNSSDLSFFEYLGAMVDDEGDWLDPLQLAEQIPDDFSERVDSKVEPEPIGEAL